MGQKSSKRPSSIKLFFSSKKPSSSSSSSSSEKHTNVLTEPSPLVPAITPPSSGPTTLTPPPAPLTYSPGPSSSVPTPLNPPPAPLTPPPAPLTHSPGPSSSVPTPLPPPPASLPPPPAPLTHSPGPSSSVPTPLNPAPAPLTHSPGPSSSVPTPLNSPSSPLTPPVAQSPPSAPNSLTSSQAPLTSTPVPLTPSPAPPPPTPSSSSVAQQTLMESPPLFPASILAQPPPPPPAPPLLSHSLMSTFHSHSGPGSTLSAGLGLGSGRFRSVFWDRISQERVEGRHSIWTQSEEFLIDLSSLNKLFGRRQGPNIKDLRVRDHSDTHTPGRSPLERISVLEVNRSLKVGIFLHHCKRSSAEIINDVREGRSQHYSSEQLTELYKLLPDPEEEQRLRPYSGERSNLQKADLFMLHLVEIPRFRLRLQAMILQEEFDSVVTSVLESARCLTMAATELMECVELHFILRLVLKVGNYMNAGGFAGNAAGFRISSLLKLADTKSNSPGMTLLHFVAMEAVRKDPSILSYHLKLKHVEPASRLSVEAMQEEFNELQCRVTSLLQGVGNAPDLHTQTTSFLQSAQVKLCELQVEVDSLRRTQCSLLEFFCEDDDGNFKLEEACSTFLSFQQLFLRAAQENVLREQMEQWRLARLQVERKRVGNRHSIASFSALEVGLQCDNEALERVLLASEATPRRRGLGSTLRRKPQRSTLISVVEKTAENASLPKKEGIRATFLCSVAANSDANPF